MCEMKQGTALGCPDEWKIVSCDSTCDQNEELTTVLAECKEESEIKVLCSKTTADIPECIGNGKYQWSLECFFCQLFNKIGCHL